MIVLEDRFEEMFDVLPSMKNSKSSNPNFEYKVKFGYGDDKELMSFLIANKNNDVYPLIWLIHTYEETHSKNKVEFNNLSFILTTETNIEMLNKERINSTVKQVLTPLYDNIIQLFNKSNILNFNEEIKLVKHLNYFNEKLPGVRESLKSSEQNKTITPWDAFKITISGSLNNKCFRKEIKFK